MLVVRLCCGRVPSIVMGEWNFKVRGSNLSYFVLPLLSFHEYFTADENVRLKCGHDVVLNAVTHLCKKRQQPSSLYIP